jgi:signal transduction histidine kinase
MTLFSIYFGSNAKAQGFGLGAVKRLTEALNGSVTPKNEIGKGTKFNMGFQFWKWELFQVSSGTATF